MSKNSHEVTIVTNEGSFTITVSGNIKTLFIDNVAYIVYTRTDGNKVDRYFK